MSDDLVTQGEGNTPLEHEELEGLIPSYITVRSELNRAEQANILEAQAAAYAQTTGTLSVEYLNELHRRMFHRVWKWAGKFRQSEKNIGIQAYQIPTSLRELVDDTNYWIENHTYATDELGARFHHRLVYIHAYPNGNGRHARLATDLLLHWMGEDAFSWGRQSLTEQGNARSRYVQALRSADGHDYALLLDFVRS